MRLAILFGAVSALCASVFYSTSSVQAQNAAVTSDIVVCQSVNGQRNTCRVQGRIERADPIAQFSIEPCIYGSSWGYSKREIWVDQGCFARFEVQLRKRAAQPTAPAPEVRPTETASGPVSVICKSRGILDRQVCRVKGRIERVDPIEAYSELPCVEGFSWGQGKRYVWVDNGCHAKFDVTLKQRVAKPPKVEPEPPIQVDPVDTTGETTGTSEGLSASPLAAIVAQGACSGLYGNVGAGSGDGAFVFAVPRTCSANAPDCSKVCKGIRSEAGRQLKSRKLGCFNSVHVYDEGGTPQPGIPSTATYVYNSCGGSCGPNFCCCMAQ